MKKLKGNKGSVLIVVVFAAALLSVITVGMLMMSTEEIQLLHNQMGAAEAMATAEAGLNDAFSRIRQGNDPNIGSQSFNGGSYTVTAGASSVADLLVTSTGMTSQGFSARFAADIAVGGSSPYVIKIAKLRINE